MRSLITADPFRCRVWQLHDRLEEEITLESCKTEIVSFEQHGQLVPVLGRPLQGDPNHEIELIFGARRLFVARTLKKLLRVEVRAMSDREAIVAMDIENRHRRDISPYERGHSYARWLRSGYFASQHDLAAALEVSPSQVSRLLKFARLPSVIINAFESPLDICEGWCLDLAAALEDPERRQSAIQAARSIATTSPRPAACDVYRQLLVPATRGRKTRPPAHDKVVKGRNGQPLFRVKFQRSSIALVLPLEKTSSRTLAEIERAVANILDPSDFDNPDDSLILNTHDAASRLFCSGAGT